MLPVLENTSTVTPSALKAGGACSDRTERRCSVEHFPRKHQYHMITRVTFEKGQEWYDIYVISILVIINGC